MSLDQQKRQERIEAFLRNELSPEEHSRFQQELESDADLSADLALHKMMYEEFEDAVKKDFIKKLETKSDEHFGPRQSNRKKWWIWIFSAALLVALAFFLNRLTPISANRPETPAEVSPDEPTTAPADSPEINNTQELPTNEIQEVENDPPQDAQQDPPQSPPIAQLDPADFVETSYFENLISSAVRGDDLRFEEVQALWEDEQFSISGEIQKLASEDGTLLVFVYSNKEQDYLDGNFLLSEPISLQAINSTEVFQTADGRSLEAFSFTFTQKVDWDPGLYYYFLAWERDEEPLFTRKIEIKN